MTTIYTVIVYRVFGGIENVENFLEADAAYKYFFNWANNNNTENLTFNDVNTALEWFGANEEELDYTIGFCENMVDEKHFIEPTLKGITKAYVNLEVVGGEFADDIYDNMDENFEKPHDIAKITKAIQDFRSWDADEDDEVVEATIEYVQYVQISNIKWDADNEGDVADLPTSTEIKVPMSIFENIKPNEYKEIASDYMSDELSNKFGFCHKGFDDNFDVDNYFENSFQDYMYNDGSLVEEGTRVGLIKNKKLELDKTIFYVNEPTNTYLKKAEKAYQSKRVAYYNCYRWYADALTFLSDRRIDTNFNSPIQVVKDEEDGVIVEVVLQDDINFIKLKEHMQNYYKEQLGTYPENVSDDEKKDAKNELENIITAMQQAKADNYDYITLEAE